MRVISGSGMWGNTESVPEAESGAAVVGLLLGLAE